MKQYRNIIVISLLLAGLLSFAGYYYRGTIIFPTNAPAPIYALPVPIPPGSAPADTSPTPAAIPSTNSFNLVLYLTSGARSLQENFTAGTNLLDALKSATKREGIEIKVKEYLGMGSLVESLGGTKNGTDGKYWQFWVNGQYSNVGASSYVIKQGDVIEWKFTKE